MDDEGYTLRQFILDQMSDRHMSARQFAEFVGVAHTTINRAVDTRKEPKPSIEFLLSLSKATNVSVLTLLEMAYPDEVKANAVTPSIQVMAQMLSELPENIQQAIHAIIFSSRK